VSQSALEHLTENSMKCIQTDSKTFVVKQTAAKAAFACFALHQKCISFLKKIQFCIIYVCFWKANGTVSLPNVFVRAFHHLMRILTA